MNALLWKYAPLAAVSALIVGCSSPATRQTRELPATAVSKRPAQTSFQSRTVASTKTTAPDWKTDRQAWCRMREQQKAARRSADQPIAGTTNTYLISVHDEMCKVQ